MTVDELREEARRWLSMVEIPDEPLDLTPRFRVLRDWQRTLAEAGWLGIDWPEDAGGRGLTPEHQLAFYQELARAAAPAPIGLIGLGVVGPSIIEHGTQEQRQRLVPPLLSGDEIWCQGFSEPDAGSDLAAQNTRAVLDGDDFVITGQKVWTSWAHEAAWCAVLARTDPDAPKHRGISYILVPMELPGITVRPLVQLTGDAEFNEVFFDEVRVPRSNLLGELNQGWQIAMHTLGHERGSYTVRRQAEIQAVFWRLLDQLGAGRDQAVSYPESTLERLGESLVMLRALEAQTRGTIGRLAGESGPSALDSVDKLLLNEVEQRVAANTFDLLGPHRIASGTPYGLDAERWLHGYLFSRAISIYGGTSQIQRNIVAERQLGLPKG